MEGLDAEVRQLREPGQEPGKVVDVRAREEEDHNLGLGLRRGLQEAHQLRQFQSLRQHHIVVHQPQRRRLLPSAYVTIRQHTSAYVRISEEGVGGGDRKLCLTEKEIGSCA